MADIVISVTCPDAYTQRLRDAIDVLDPLPDGVTYIQQVKLLIREWFKRYVHQAEMLGRDLTVPDDIII